MIASRTDEDRVRQDRLRALSLCSRPLVTAAVWVWGLEWASWSHVGPNNRQGTILEQVWYDFGTIFGQFWDHFGTIWRAFM